jgi:alkanesulfonate monooxygenase SsuD/methylene tetrahydromethanopterin reductase-like flavin-dependent oxidoreductase (luciferase family)
LIGEGEKEIKEIIDRRKEQIHGMQQVREAKKVALVGNPDEIISGLTKYLDIGVTHFILDFVGLNANIIKLFSSRVVMKI